MAKKQKSTPAPADTVLKNVSDYRFPGATRKNNPPAKIKGFEDDQTKAKHTAANRWVEAVNNWGQLRRWAFHVCRNPQLLDKEMEYLARATPTAAEVPSCVKGGVKINHRGGGKGDQRRGAERGPQAEGEAVRGGVWSF
jgi:hypothetical protein